MAADVILPANFENIFRDVDRLLSREEKIVFNQDMKERFPGKLGLLDDENFLGTEKALYKLGAIDEDLSLLSCITERSSKKDQIKSIIAEHKPEEKSEMVGREDDVKKVCRLLENRHMLVPGVNLFGESGVGKTTLAEEIAKIFQGFTTITIELKDIVEISNVYFRLLNEFDLPAWDKNKERLLVHLKSLDENTLLIIDNIEQLISREEESPREDFITLLQDVISSNACKSGKLKFLLTSRQKISEPALRRKLFSEYEVLPFSKEVSKGFISRRTKLFVDVSEKSQDEALTEIADLCRDIPYLLQGAEQMAREGFCLPVKVLKRIKSQISQGVPREYACIGAQFESISNDNLKQLAVKISLLRHSFSVTTAMKIAEISSDYDALIDLELLTKHKVISKDKTKYKIHALFQDFVKDCLCKAHPNHNDNYLKGEKQFFQHFSGKMTKLAQHLDTEFIRTFSKLERNRANFELTIEISKTNSEAFAILLHSDDHNEAALIGILFEVLKDWGERKKLYDQWAGLAEQSGKWLTSAHLRCWQALQGPDMEGTHDAKEVLKIAEESLKKAEQTATPEQLKAGRSLFLHCSGRVKWLQASKLKAAKKKKDGQQRLDLLKEGIKNLKKALKMRQELMTEQTGTLDARTLNLIGNCYMELDDPATAEDFYHDAIVIKKKLVGSEKHWEIPTFYNQMSQVHDRRGMKIEKGWFGFLFKDKAEAEYRKAVEWMKKALELQEELGVSDTEHTATFQRNLANSLIGIGEYEEALKYATKCYNNRLERLGKHPETVRILYLTGIIHEWRKDTEAACESYEKAFEMEEVLPEYNHSLARELIRDRLKVMYKKLKLKDKLEELGSRIKAIEEEEGAKSKLPSTQGLPSQELEVPPDDGAVASTSGVHFQEELCDDVEDEECEVYISVNKQGGSYNHLVSTGCFLYFPPETVTECTRIKCKLVRPKTTLPSPTKAMETCISSVVELGPSSIALKHPIIVTLLHCGPGKELGYETRVKVFNQASHVWEEGQEPQHVFPVKCPTDSIQVEMTKLTTVVVITRLITDTFEVPVSGCVVRSSVCHDLTLHFPQGAVDRTIRGSMKVVLIPNHLLKDPDALPCPVLLFSGFSNVTFMEPVDISIPLPSRTATTDSVRVVRLDDIRQPPYRWVDITGDTIAWKDKGVVKLKVQRFCGLWVWQTCKSVIDTAYSLYETLVQPPCTVCFAAYQRKQTSIDGSSKFNLKLTCAANYRQEDLTEKVTTKGFITLDECVADAKMTQYDRAYPDINVDKSQWEREFFLQYLGSDQVCQKSLQIQTTSTEIKLSFYREQEPKENRLCKLLLIKHVEESAAQEITREQTSSIWVEYCGIDFQTLRELPEDIVNSLINCCKVNADIITGYRARWYDDYGAEKFFTQFPREFYHTLVETLCLKEFEDNSEHILRLLQYGHRMVVETTLSDVPREVQEQTISIVTEHFQGSSALKLGQTLGLSEEYLCNGKSPRDIITFWMENCISSNLADLFGALRICGSVEAAKTLAEFITVCAKRETGVLL